eukprot:5829212-Amphidinium_carterae.1
MQQYAGFFSRTSQGHLCGCLGMSAHEDQWQMPTRFLNTNNFANRPLAPGALFSATRTASVRHVVPSKNKLVSAA